MIWIALLLGLVATFFSSFFSGSETGFYRATRIRLVLDALEGDWISRGLVLLTNQPTLFIATALVGNNVANYFVSLATVLATQALIGVNGFLPELIAPLIVAPILFIYGELLPKTSISIRPTGCCGWARPVSVLHRPLPADQPAPVGPQPPARPVHPRYARQGATGDRTARRHFSKKGTRPASCAPPSANWPGASSRWPSCRSAASSFPWRTSPGHARR